MRIQYLSSKSAKNVLAAVYEKRNQVFVDYLPIDKTINSDYSSKHLKQLYVKIRQKISGVQKKKHFSSQQRTLSHISKTIAKVSKLKYELLQHPSFSPPDFVPSYFCLFLHQKGISNLQDHWNKCVKVQYYIK